MRILALTLMLIVAVAISLIPELIMFGLWSWLAPEGFWERLTVVLVFIFLGGASIGWKALVVYCCVAMTTAGRVLLR